jgi:phosphoribosylformylglycinamidine (FGAM) synthase-like enzyme
MVFDSVYQGNPLVNALAVGVMRHEDIRWPTRPARATRLSCSVHAPVATALVALRCWPPSPSTPPSPTKRPAVQVGDPFAEKVLIECCLELFKGAR